MVQIKHFTAPQKMPNFQFSRRANWTWRDKILGAPILDKAFHLQEFQAKLFFIRNQVGGFYWGSLLNIFFF